MFSVWGTPLIMTFLEVGSWAFLLRSVFHSPNFGIYDGGQTAPQIQFTVASMLRRSANARTSSPASVALTKAPYTSESRWTPIFLISGASDPPSALKLQDEFLSELVRPHQEAEP